MLLASATVDRETSRRENRRDTKRQRESWARSRKAEKQFARIAKKRKGTTWGENSQYYLAECQFQRKKYVDAHDSFERLHADYPATEYRAEADRPRVHHRHSGSPRPTPAPAEKNCPGPVDSTAASPVIDTQGSGPKALRARPQKRPDRPAG
jgi:hypothetical protein